MVLRKLILHQSVNFLHTRMGISSLPVQVQDMSIRISAKII